MHSFGLINTLYTKKTNSYMFVIVQTIHKYKYTSCKLYSLLSRSN